SFASMPQYRIKTDLLPVLRSGVFFDVEVAKKTCIEYLSDLLVPTDKELAFWTAFGHKEYRPELLFDDPDILARIAQHPMALWKCSDKADHHLL
ncbi:MAG: nucleotidyl transferase AbiEii/AbiGii toxin family protein, partial [Clostridia bacterium]